MTRSTRTGRALLVIGLLAAASIAAVVAWMVVGLFRASGPGTAQFQPSLPLVIALRADDEALHVWTGPPCPSVDQIWMNFRGDDGARARTVLEASAPRDIEELTVGDPVSGFTAREALPPGFDWRTYDEVTVGFQNDEGPFPGTGDLDTVDAQSADHPDAFHIANEGWLKRAEILERNGQDFLIACTPDPERE